MQELKIRMIVKGKAGPEKVVSVVKQIYLQLNCILIYTWYIRKLFASKGWLVSKVFCFIKIVLRNVHVQVLLPCMLIIDSLVARLLS